MQFTNIHQMIGYRGVVFDVLEFEVMRRSQFGALYFDVARQVKRSHHRKSNKGL